MIVRTFRVVKKNYASIAFNGEGALKNGGRWNSIGTPVVYTSESLSLATLEILAGGVQISLLQSFVTITAHFDSSCIEIIPTSHLPKEWNDYPYTSKSQIIGDAWIKESKNVVLKVPSSVIKGECNYVINPFHADFKKIVLGEPEDFIIDKRLVKK